MHADDLRFNARVLSTSAMGAVRGELERLGFPGDIRDLAPPKLAQLWVAVEGLTAAEAQELRARWASGGGEVLVAGDPFATVPVPAVVRGSREQFERGAEACPGLAPAAAMARAVAAWHATPAPIAGLEWGRRTHVMGVVNVTPDSFSDGGKFFDPARAIAHGEALAAAGASILDVGGESTRPGASEVAEAEEIERVVPVVRGLARSGLKVSIDTTKAAVAEAALDAGAALVNDISGFGFDAGMAPLVARRGVPAVLMHIRGVPRTMQLNPQYRDPVAEICARLREAIARAGQAGVPADRLVVDPGIGFGKTLEHNLDILARLRELRTLGRPVLVGVSRKAFLGKLTGLPVDRRAVPSAGAAAWCIAAGADLLRVHDVAETEAVRQVVDAIARPG